MQSVVCPYCKSNMRLIENIRTNNVRGYYVCDSCSARSPRVRHDFVDDVEGYATRDMLPKTLSLIEELAYNAAVRSSIDDDFEISDEEIDEILNYNFD